MSILMWSWPTPGSPSSHAWWTSKNTDTISPVSRRFARAGPENRPHGLPLYSLATLTKVSTSPCSTKPPKRAVLCSTQVMWPLPLVELHAVGRAWNPNVAKSREVGVFLPVGDSAPPIFAPGLSIRPPPVIRKHAALTAQQSGRGATERVVSAPKPRKEKASSGSLDASLVTLGTDAAGSGVRSTPRGHWCFAQLPTSLGYDARLPGQRDRRTISMWVSCAAIGSEPFF